MSMQTSHKTYITRMPDKAGAFLAASKAIAECGGNIVRVNYNKAVDTHTLFIEVDATDEQHERINAALKEVEYLAEEPAFRQIILIEMKLRDKPGVLLRGAKSAGVAVIEDECVLIVSKTAVKKVEKSTKKKKMTCTVESKLAHLKKIQIENTYLETGEKETIELSYGVKPTSFTWKSSNKAVATVSKKGVVKAKKPGTVKITVTTENGKKATIKITISAKQ